MKIKEFSTVVRNEFDRFNQTTVHKLSVLVDGEVVNAAIEIPQYSNGHYYPREEIVERLIRGISNEITSRLRGMLA